MQQSTSSNYNRPNAGRVTRFLWWSSGADRFLLEKCTYKDHVKYACLGGIIVATGLMAALSGGYAFYYIFSPKGSVFNTDIHYQTMIFSMIFGLIWGLIIFNLDRFIITSTGLGDGTEAITKDELIGALPRIVLGLIIAITISQPMEIRIFQSEIDVQLRLDQHKKHQEYIEQIEKNFSGRLLNLKSQKNDFRKQMNQSDSIAGALQQRYLDETQRPDRRGIGRIAESIKAVGENAETEAAAVKKRVLPLIDGVEKQIQEAETEKMAAINEGKEASNNLDGLLERIKLSHQIAGWAISLFITLLFVAIELTPIFFKLMLIKSPYDFLNDNEGEIIKAEQGIQIKYNYYQDKKGRESDLVVYHKAKIIEDQQVGLAEAQREVSEYAVQKWKENEKRKIDQNPDAYIS
jgi:hypothetical protein